MQQIFNFLIRNVNSLLFLLLFGIGLSLTIHSHSYHKSKFIHSANSISGSFYSLSNSVSQYFDLKTQNEILIKENKTLRTLLYNSDETYNINAQDSLLFSNTNYKITTAEVYKNSYSKTQNYLTLNKGKANGVKNDIGVISSKGIVGIIVNTTKGYASVLSILSKKSSINAKHKLTNQIGRLTWNTTSPNIVQLEDVPKFVTVNVGDTIVTGGQSSIFPKGINIGTIQNFSEDINGDTYIIDVKLFTDMTSLEHVYIIENVDKEELDRLETTNND